MDKHDQLYENYEDALFALLMDRVAQEEGERLIEENERLQNDPAAAVPESIDQKSRETIRRAFARHRRYRHGAGWYLSKIAVAILAAILLFVTAYAAIPEVRLWTIEVLLKSSDVDTRLAMSSDDLGTRRADKEEQLLAGYTLPDISDDYTVTDQGVTSREAWIMYSHENGSIIRININSYETEFLDSEDSDASEPIEVHGYSGILVEKDDAAYASWYDSDQEKVISLYTTGIGKEMALSCAQQIIFAG